MKPGVLVIETTTGVRTYSADVYRKYGAAGDRVLLVFRDGVVISEFNAAHVLRVEWSCRPGGPR